MYRIMLIMHRACGTGQIINLIHLDMQRLDDIVAQQLEARMGEQMRNIRAA
jgi:hypothetical protein